MFSLKKGIPIAKIEKGTYDGKILYLNYEAIKNNNMPLDVKIMENLKNPNLKNNKKLQLIRELLQNEIDDYSDDSSDDEDDELKEFCCDGELKVLPNIDKRQCVYVTGPSGSGKTTWIKNYSEQYKKMFPKNQVVLFSRLNEDESIDAINPTRIEISEDLLKDKITPEDLKNTLTIFDDTDTIRNKKILKEIDELKDDILQTGRHETVNTIIVSHLMSNYKQSRIVLNECQSIVFFPRCGNSYAINYVLSKYYGINNKKIKEIMNLPSRWIYLHKNYPMYVIHEKGAIIL